MLRRWKCALCVQRCAKFYPKALKLILRWSMASMFTTTWLVDVLLVILRKNLEKICFDTFARSTIGLIRHYAYKMISNHKEVCTFRCLGCGEVKKVDENPCED